MSSNFNKKQLPGGNSSYIIKVGLSSSGQHQTAIRNSGYVYKSEDYGNNWAQCSLSLSKWVDIAISESGEHQTVISNEGFVYTSGDYGNTWSERMNNIVKLYSVAMSSTGQYQVFSAGGGKPNTTSGDPDPTFGIYISCDFGHTWKQFCNCLYWNGVAINSSGNLITGIKYGSISTLCRTSDFGKTWESQDLSDVGYDSCISVSSTGQYQTIVAPFNYIYVSNDYGKTWNKKQFANQWDGICTSSNGQIQVSSSRNKFGLGMLTMSNDYGQSWVGIPNVPGLNWGQVNITYGGDIVSAVLCEPSDSYYIINM